MSAPSSSASAPGSSGLAHAGASAVYPQSDVASAAGGWGRDSVSPPAAFAEQTAGEGKTYTYRDFSSVPINPEDALLSHLASNTENRSIQSQRFPVKLCAMLSNPNFADIVSWMPHGRSWKVLRPDLFESVVMPEYFEYSNYHSFNRLVNAWSFRRVSKGVDRGSYYHELFLRGLPHLQKHMRRLPKTHRKLPTKKQDEPNFYDLAGRAPLPELGANVVADPGAGLALLLQHQAQDQAQQQGMLNGAMMGQGMGMGMMGTDIGTMLPSQQGSSNQHDQLQGGAGAVNNPAFSNPFSLTGMMGMGGAGVGASATPGQQLLLAQHQANFLHQQQGGGGVQSLAGMGMGVDMMGADGTNHAGAGVGVGAGACTPGQQLLAEHQANFLQQQQQQGVGMGVQSLAIGTGGGLGPGKFLSPEASTVRRGLLTMPDDLLAQKTNSLDADQSSRLQQQQSPHHAPKRAGNSNGNHTDGHGQRTLSMLDSSGASNNGGNSQQGGQRGGPHNSNTTSDSDFSHASSSISNLMAQQRALMMGMGAAGEATSFLSNGMGINGMGAPSAAGVRGGNNMVMGLSMNGVGNHHLMGMMGTAGMGALSHPTAAAGGGGAPSPAINGEQLPSSSPSARDGSGDVAKILSNRAA